MSLNSNNVRIAQNTILLYIRMFIVLGVGIYSSRLLLAILGVTDFGIYNVISGIVVFLACLNNTLITTSQRFFNYTQGCGTQADLRKVFTVCFVVIVVIILLIVLITETFGLWYVYNVLDIPSDRVKEARIIYQIAILTIVFTTIRTPYMALVVSYENMSAYAYLTIVECLLKFGCVVGLSYVHTGDMLVLYSISLAIVSLIETTLFVFYCKYKYRDIYFEREFNRQTVREVSTFASWNFLGVMSDIGVPQGTNLLFNKAGGVLLNSAFGIASQLSSAVYGFVSNFQIAFRPQIVKMYASHDDGLFSMVKRTSKLSFFLMLLICVPFTACAEDVLHLWLGIVPEYAVGLSTVLVLSLLVDSATGPLWMLIQATGKIRNYQIRIVLLSLCYLMVVFLLLYFGCNYVEVASVKILLSISFLWIQLSILCKIINIHEFMKIIVRYDVLSALLSFGLVFLIKPFFSGLFGFFALVVLSIVIACVIIYLFGLDKQERVFIIQKIKQRIK